MSDVLPDGGHDWMGLAYILAAGLISVGVEYLRRMLPPERRDRRKGDKKGIDNSENEENG